ncbi:hypothetical protein [Tsukamurella soli]|uniref:Integral membrane protein n=1 Tax=Tsukamurella soli TaxID=644556 RepID=A0ABP8JUA0_9ACTN
MSQPPYRPGNEPADDDDQSSIGGRHAGGPQYTTPSSDPTTAMPQSPRPGGTPPSFSKDGPGGRPGGQGQGGYPPPPQGFGPQGPAQGGYPQYGQGQAQQPYGQQGQPPYGQPGQGGYPPPGGFPPPPTDGPTGGYPPPPGGYPPVAYGGQQPYSVGDAFTWAWNKFTKNAVPLIVSMLVYAVILGVIGGVTVAGAFASMTDKQTVTTDTSVSTSGTFGGASIAIFAIGYLVLLIVGLLIGVAYQTGVLDIADGRTVTIGSFFKPRNPGAAAVTAVLVGVATVILSVLCYIPGLVFAFFAMFATFIAIDRGTGGVAAITESMRAVRDRAGDAFLGWLISVVVAVVGVVICYVGLLVGGPLAMLIQVYTYRRLTGGQVAPLTR